MRNLAAGKAVMIREHLVGRGIVQQEVLEAMRDVPREEFVSGKLVDFAYDDCPLAIEEGQTISQPYIVAYMAEALELSSEARVLEIGTGSGYSAAVMSRIAAEVISIEHFADLAAKAEERLRRLHYTNVRVFVGDGTLGWPELAPYDAIQVTAGAPHVPSALREQLAVGGRLVIPVGSHPRMQSLVRVRRITPSDYSTEHLCAVQFVPLIGKDGWYDGR